MSHDLFFEPPEEIKLVSLPLRGGGFATKQAGFHLVGVLRVSWAILKARLGLLITISFSSQMASSL
jgi:hypothetical protein